MYVCIFFIDRDNGFAWFASNIFDLGADLIYVLMCMYVVDLHDEQKCLITFCCV